MGGGDCRMRDGETNVYALFGVAMYDIKKYVSTLSLERPDLSLILETNSVP